jgi:hypothetical protein
MAELSQTLNPTPQISRVLAQTLHALDQPHIATDMVKQVRRTECAPRATHHRPSHATKHTHTRFDTYRALPHTMPAATHAQIAGIGPRVLVTVTQHSPLPLRDHAQLLSKLDDAGIKAFLSAALGHVNADLASSVLVDVMDSWGPEARQRCMAAQMSTVPASELEEANATRLVGLPRNERQAQLGSILKSVDDTDVRFLLTELLATAGGLGARRTSAPPHARAPRGM